MLAELENAENDPQGITHPWLVTQVFDENGVYDPEKGAEWLRDLKYTVAFYQNVFDLGEEKAVADMKVTWQERCAEKGIGCVDTESDGLWIFCTEKQLVSMIPIEERRFTNYELSLPTLKEYTAERAQIVDP